MENDGKLPRRQPGAHAPEPRSDDERRVGRPRAASRRAQDREAAASKRGGHARLFHGSPWPAVDLRGDEAAEPSLDLRGDEPPVEEPRPDTGAPVHEAGGVAPRSGDAPG
jgi:hypothetical protein